MQETTPQQEQTFGFVNFENWMSLQSGKFAERSNPTRRILYALAAIACALIIFWPEVIPWFPIWMIRTAAIIGTLICGLLSYTDGTEWYSLQSGGTVRHRATKKFDNSFVKRSQVLEAFQKRDFNFLLDAQDANDQPIQLNIHEDAAGKTLYLFVNKYFTSSDLRPITDVMVVEGKEYDSWGSVIKSIKSTN